MVHTLAALSNPNHVNPNPINRNPMNMTYQVSWRHPMLCRCR